MDTMTNSSIPSRQNKRHKKRRRFLRLSIVITMIVLMLGFLGRSIARGFEGGPAAQDSAHDVVVSDPDAVKRPARFNVLVMGVDQRPGDVGRSDTMMVVSVGNVGQAMVMSVPRDTRVNIPGHGLDKVNHAFAYGGPELSTNVVSELLGIPLDGYVTMNLNVFEHIIDMLGGVPIDVEKRMAYVDHNQDLVIDLHPGQQRLDGDQAMQYVRYRSDGLGDLGRIERQQKFLKAFAQEAMSPENVIKMPALVREIFDNVGTNMSLPDALKALTMGTKSYSNGITGGAVPGYADYIDGISYYLPDREALTRIVSETMN